MKQRFLSSNPQFKRSTLALLSVLLLLLGLQWWCYQSDLQRQKQDYIDLVGAISAKAVSINPDCEREIIPAITTELNAQARAAGRNWMEKYGITSAVENSLFPNLHTLPLSFFLTLAAACILLALHYAQQAAVLDKVRGLTAAAKHLLKEDYLTEDMAAEQKARVTYDNILRLAVDDPDVTDVIRFLRAREIVHFQRFGSALQLVREKLDHKNVYYTNPAFDR
ncbi:MAG: manganese catalase family protein [Evtepia sp.]|uniref:manganese catalase family protein n=1 Tax=Evtepia sp. TaxID=2773933 RepID=UPI002A74C66C|nr:manganese catalase family protein [Evtepia sp.]MDY3013857.1 manganese catalase family protein [Evtepia sp.]